jgi:hypothetical protein
VDIQARRDELVTRFNNINQTLTQLSTEREQVRGAIVAFDEVLKSESEPQNPPEEADADTSTGASQEAPEAEVE